MNITMLLEKRQLPIKNHKEMSKKVLQLNFSNKTKLIIKVTRLWRLDIARQFWWKWGLNVQSTPEKAGGNSMLSKGGDTYQ